MSVRPLLLAALAFGLCLGLGAGCAKRIPCRWREGAANCGMRPVWHTCECDGVENPYHPDEPDPQDRCNAVETVCAGTIRHTTDYQKRLEVFVNDAGS